MSGVVDEADVYGGSSFVVQVRSGQGWAAKGKRGGDVQGKKAGRGGGR